MFLYDTYAEYSSYKKCCYKLRWKFPDLHVPIKVQVYKYMKRL